MKKYVIGVRQNKLRVLSEYKVHPVIWIGYVLSTALASAYIVSGAYTSLYVVSAEAHQSAMQPKQAVVEPVEHTFSALFMGDVMLDRSVGGQIAGGHDPFAGVRASLDAADIRIANIETTIADPAVATQANKRFTFNAPLESLGTLKNAQIDVSVLANNHTSDYGPIATANMLDQFAASGLKTVGAGRSINEAFKPLLIELPVPGTQDSVITVGFVAINDIENNHTRASATRTGSAHFDESRVIAAIGQARSEGADVVVVLTHWGTEYTHQVSARQRQWGRFLIDNGANLVVGGHPHVIQPTEVYKNASIIYSLGNFIFDGMEGAAPGDAARSGNMASVPITLSITSTGERSVSVQTPQLIPYRLDARGFPQPSL